MKHLTMAAMCAVALLITVFNASAVFIDFESDPFGPKPNGWTSADSPLVHFSNSIDQNLRVGDWGSQGDGRSLGVFHDDPSALYMDFDVLMSSIVFEFGNDDPGWSKTALRSL